MFFFQFYFSETSRSAGFPYESSQAASAGGDLELSVEIPDGAGGEEALHQQQHSEHEEAGGEAVDDVLQDVDAEERATRRCLSESLLPGRRRTCWEASGQVMINTSCRYLQ